MFRCLIGASFRDADQPANRRAIDDSPAFLLAHLPEFVFHAIPYSTQIDVHDTVISFTAGVGGFRNRTVDAGIVIRCIQTSARNHDFSDHGLDLSFVRNITLDGHGFEPLFHEFFRLLGRLVDIG